MFSGVEKCIPHGLLKKESHHFNDFDNRALVTTGAWTTGGRQKRCFHRAGNAFSMFQGVGKRILPPWSPSDHERFDRTADLVYGGC